MSDFTDYVKKYSPPIEDTVFEEMKKIVQKHQIDYKKDLGYMEFPRGLPEVSPSKFQEIAAEAEQKLKELNYYNYDVFETTIIIDFPGEKKAYEEWERAGKPTHSPHSSHLDSACPRCSSSNTFHDAKTGVTECLKCHHKWKKPTMKELMTGTVLDGHIEAARVTPLTGFTESSESKEEKFWTDIDVQIEDEIKAHDEYRRLAREAEQLGILEPISFTESWLDNIAKDEERHKEALLAIKRHYLK